MSDSMGLQFFLGLVGTLLAFGLGKLLFQQLVVQVEDEHQVLVTEFGKLTRILKEPGAHFLWARLNPQCRTYPVSLQRDFRTYSDLHINDQNGTTVLVDLWVEFRIAQPERALFGVENWEETLASGVSHAAMSVLSSLEFKEILAGSVALSERILGELSESGPNWGLVIENIQIRDVGLLPEVSKQLFASVGARLERAKALIEERGRIAISELDAKTAKEVARLKGEARAQYPLELSRVFETMAKSPRVLAAYRQLHRFGRTQPSKTIYFDGFKEGELRAVDAAMLWPNSIDAGPSVS